METVEQNIEEFKKNNFIILSPYFINIFSPYFKKVVVEKDINKNKNRKIIFDVLLDENCANILSTIHGGAIATLMDSLATVSLYYLVNQKYKTKTIDININYKTVVELNEEYQIIVECQKIENATSFVEVKIIKNEQICVQASIIKTRVGPKF